MVYLNLKELTVRYTWCVLLSSINTSYITSPTLAKMIPFFHFVSLLKLNRALSSTSLWNFFERPPIWEASLHETCIFTKSKFYPCTWSWCFSVLNKESAQFGFKISIAPRLLLTVCRYLSASLFDDEWFGGLSLWTIPVDLRNCSNSSERSWSALCVTEVRGGPIWVKNISQYFYSMVWRNNFRFYYFGPRGIGINN